MSASRIPRRGDNIPPVSDYAHWNEEAYSMWYNENKYDMEHADEPLDDPYDEDRWPSDEDGEDEDVDS